MGVALLKTALLCILAIALNMLTSYIAVSMPVLLFPVFWDMIFTVAITFYSGLVPGLIAAAGFNPLMTVLRCAINGTAIFYYDFFYALCGMIIVVVTWAISHNKKEFFFTRMVTILYLLIISLASAFASCLCASLLDTFVRPFFDEVSGFSAIDSAAETLQSFQFNTFLSFLFPRIPITVLDRVICTFAGFGVYRLMCRLKIELLKSYAKIDDGCEKYFKKLILSRRLQNIKIYSKQVFESLRNYLSTCE